MPCPDKHRTIAANRTTRHHKKQEERHLILHYFLSSSLCILCKIAFSFIAALIPPLLLHQMLSLSWLVLFPLHPFF